MIDIVPLVRLETSRSNNVAPMTLLPTLILSLRSLSCDSSRSTEELNIVKMRVEDSLPKSDGGREIDDCSSSSIFTPSSATVSACFKLW